MPRDPTRATRTRGTGPAAAAAPPPGCSSGSRPSARRWSGSTTTATPVSSPDLTTEVLSQKRRGTAAATAPVLRTSRPAGPGTRRRPGRRKVPRRAQPSSAGRGSCAASGSRWGQLSRKTLCNLLQGMAFSSSESCASSDGVSDGPSEKL